MKLRALVSVGLVALPSSLAAAEASESLGVISGANVMERPAAGSPWKAPNGKKLHAGWDVRCAEGCVLAISGGGLAELAPGSELRDRIAIFARVGENLAVRATGLELRSGAIRVDLARSKRALVLESRTGTALLIPEHGAGGAVVHERDASLGATHLDAHVRAPHARWQALPEGLAVDAHDSVINRARALPIAPTWQLAGFGAGPVGLASAGASARVGGAWSPVDGAATYAIEIARDAAFTDLVAIRSSDEARAAEELAPGRYFARVAGVDSAGLAGPTSKAREIRVVPVVVPPGGLTDVGERTLVVPPSRALAIADADGLEFGVGRMTFQPLAAVNLAPAAKSERLWMRLRGDVMSASMVMLEPRALRADVELSPRNARWPADPIDITVRLSDPSHRVDPSTIELKLKAMLDLDDLPLAWSHDGSVWRAHVTPRGILRNTVVRIEATDEHDNPLGRGFAEIAPTIVKATTGR